MLFRVAALVILCAVALLSAIAHQPREADFPEFTAALDRGEVVRVVLPESNSSPESVWKASWSTGPLHWREGDVASPPVRSEEFFQSMNRHGVRIDWDHGDDDGILDWPFWSPAWIGAVVSALWLATFFTMLASIPRYANRWAWFWLFTIGEIGVFLYLLVEPAPLWRARTDGDLAPVTAEVSPDNRVTGTQGCVLSILTAIGAPIVAAAVGWAAGHVLP